MLEADRIKHKALRRLYREGDVNGLYADWIDKLKRMLQALDAITHPGRTKRTAGMEGTSTEGAQRRNLVTQSEP